MSAISRFLLHAAALALGLAGSSIAFAATAPATAAAEEPAADQAVTVTFADTSKFTDAANSRFDVDTNMKTLATYLQKLGKQYLPPGQTLKIDVLDVDLAGEAWPSRRTGQDLRILRGGADWPRIKLHYALSSGGSVVQSGEETVADLGYLSNMGAIYRTSDPLRYEKAMLNDWFEGKFSAPKAAAAPAAK